MTVESLKLRYKKPTFKIVFNDPLRRITVRGKGIKQRCGSTVTLNYDRSDYACVKEKLQSFLAEQKLTNKMCLLADAVNIGSENTELDELVFLLIILWYYEWEKEATN